MIVVNRRALHDYTVLARFEAGIELRGTEVKSVRSGEVHLGGGFARVEKGSVVLYDVNISPYEYGNQFNHDPDRPRQLLLHAREIKSLAAGTNQKGLSIIPLRLYLKRGWVKVELGLCRGRKLRDKRETLRRRTAEREASRAMAGSLRNPR